MKPSELIKIGSDGMEQVTDVYIECDSDGVKGCCALGAVLLGLSKGGEELEIAPDCADPGWSKRFNREGRTLLVEHIPELFTGVDPKAMPYEQATDYSPFVHDIIVTLNDNHKWSFDQIIEWLKSIDL